MLQLNGRALVLWVHVLAACIWIGGQLAVAVLMPALRGAGGLAAVAGRRFQRIAWPAFLILLITGVVNARNAGITWGDLVSSAMGRTLVVKVGFVALSGAAAAAHAFIVAPRSRDGPARPAVSTFLGSISVIAAVVAALYGVLIAQR
jgi:putative copper export protein